ncbi:MAG TPA: tRNA pseudouridine(38-40) synthase TruA [Thermodesulfobacteriota bacterium]
MPRTLKLTVEYLGAGFSGWQAQASGRRTVQGVLAEAVARVTGERAVVHGAGRTDAGVHALGQAASLVLERSAIAPAALRDAMNAVLPPDVSVRAVEEAPDGFHARKDAVAKRYRYLILVSPARSALWEGRAWHRRGPLDVDAMRRAASALVGTHDFSAFRASASEAPTAVRTISRLAIEADPAAEGLLRIEVEGDGFLMHMVRIIVGTLVEVGRGKLPAGRVSEILAGRDRRAAGPTAPAHGLYLVDVRYGGPPLR